jgi:hypothetical protein
MARTSVPIPSTRGDILIARPMMQIINVDSHEKGFFLRREQNDFEDFQALRLKYMVRTDP